MALNDYLAEEIAQDCADGLLSRREALRRLGLLGLSATVAGGLLAACASDDDDRQASSTTTTTTAPAATGPPAGAGTLITFAGPNGDIHAAWAAPPTAPKGAVLVVHENRGLVPHFYDVVGRLAGDGYAALCVDLVDRPGGTAALRDPAEAQAALGEAPATRLVANLRAGIDELQRRAPGAAVGAVGFCFGGGMVWELLHTGEQRLAAAAPFYGRPPDNPDFGRARAAVLAVYGALDSRVNASRQRAEQALKAAGLTNEVRVFEGADHAFFNETGPRYNAEAARQAYAALLDWFGRHLR